MPTIFKFDGSYPRLYIAFTTDNFSQLGKAPMTSTYKYISIGDSFYLTSKIFVSNPSDALVRVTGLQELNL